MSHAMSKTLPPIAAPLIIAATAACGCVLLNLADPTTPGGPTPVCPTKALFGINCPFCGTARMLYSLCHLDLAAALRYNALTFALVLLLIWSWIAWTGGILGKHIPTWHRWRYTPWVIGIVVAIWTVIRLLPFEPFRSLQV